MTDERQIDYEAMLHEALRDAQRGVMRTVLTRVAELGLPGEHHFYISFNTLAPGVSIAPRLLQKYPTEMTIVLQHRFWDLFVQADRFEVKLTFDGIRERLVIPFAAVRMFFDPSVPYGLQFDEGDMRTPPIGEIMGMGGSRSGGRATSRAAGDRTQPERKKTQRKKQEIVSDADVAADVKPMTGSENVSALPAPASKSDSTVQAAADKPGPRLVETANDSAKVVSLDQFRKK